MLKTNCFAQLVNKTEVMTKTKQQDVLFKVLCFIQSNLEEEISLNEMASVAHISPYHFHRLFKEFTGENVKSYLRRLRLENAAFRLRTQQEKIIDIALESGFYTHETFSRAFSKRFGQNPSIYKNTNTFKFSDQYIDQITKVQFQKRSCIFKRYIGPYAKSGTPEESNSLWHQLSMFLPSHHRNLDRLDIFGISHDDPGITSEKNIRYDACLAVPRDVYLGETTLKIPAGAYLVARHKGPFSNLTDSYYYLIYHWIQLYGFQVDHRISPFEKFELSDSPTGYHINSILIHIPLMDK